MLHFFRVLDPVGAKMDKLFEKSYTTQFATSTYSNSPSPRQLHQLARVFKDSAINHMFNDCRKGWFLSVVIHDPACIVSLLGVVLGQPESGTFSSLFPELKVSQTFGLCPPFIQS